MTSGLQVPVVPFSDRPVTLDNYPQPVLFPQLEHV